MFGIYIGNSSACIALLKDGDVQVLPNEEGNAVTASTLEILDNERVVGVSEKSENVIFQSKMYFIPDCVAIHEVEGYCRVKKEEETYNYVVDVGNKKIKVTPEEVATHIFMSLYKIAVSATQGTENHEMKAILSVPKAFSADACEKYTSAASKAGFEIHQIISDAAAAILAYDRIAKNESCRKYLICRIGGATVEVSVVERRAEVLKILHTKYVAGLSGDFLTSTIFNYLAKDVESKLHFNPLDKPRCRMKLHELAKQCKHTLSRDTSMTCFLESFYKDIDYSLMITRSTIESVISSAVNMLMKPVKDVLTEINMQPGDVETVILCGGTMEVPKIKSYFNEVFGNSEILSSISPDEVIAVGAAKHGLYSVNELSSSEVLTLDEGVYVKTSYHGDYILVLEKGSLIPARSFHTVSIEGQDEITLEYYQGEPGDLELIEEVLLGPLDASEEIKAEVIIDSEGNFECKIHPS